MRLAALCGCIFALIKHWYCRTGDLQAIPKPAISDAALIALQARIEALGASQLLSENELFAMEDAISDFLEVRTSAKHIP